MESNLTKSEPRSQQAKWQARMIAAGRCRQCGSDDVPESYKRCRKCLKKEKMRVRRLTTDKHSGTVRSPKGRRGVISEQRRKKLG